MAQLANPRTSQPKPLKTLEKQFRELETAWTRDTAFLSSDLEIVDHPAFREIIRMGESVVPFMLRDMEKQPRLWVWALPEITGANPVAAEDRGNIVRMTDTWLRWAKASGYQW